MEIEKNYLICSNFAPCKKSIPNDKQVRRMNSLQQTSYTALIFVKNQPQIWLILGILYSLSLSLSAQTR